MSDDKETASFWATESARHVVTYGGSATGIFGVAGLLLWNSAATCTRDTIGLGPLCTKEMNVGVTTLHSGAELGVFVALTILLVSVVCLCVLSSKHG